MDSTFRPSDADNLVELLRRRVQTNTNSNAGYRFLVSRDTGKSLTFAELDQAARALAVYLRERFAPGHRVLLCYPPGLEFLVGFFGSLYAGLIAIPAYPPRPHKPDSRLESMAANSRAAVALAPDALVRDRERLTAQVPSLAAIPWLSSCGVDPALGDAWTTPVLNADDVAVLQYTSGSTGDPRGVMLSHRCILHNVENIRQSMELPLGITGVSWLPAFHDMGLIGNLLGCLGFNGTLGILSPVAFLQDPFRWLQSISDMRAMISGGPCFAYEQCMKRITPDQRRELDLSCWKVAYVGAEPISARVLDAFADTFAECGFRREFFYPCYGLAESSLLVTGAGAIRPRVSFFASRDLETGSAHRDDQGRAVVSCGVAAAGMDVRIVDPDTNVCVTDGTVGEVWVSGPSVALGYFERPEQNATTFGATLRDRPGVHYLRTGDLGFLHENELYITGRLKDVMIIRGRNYYPQDIEEAGQLVCPELRPGCGAAFVLGEGSAARLILVYEVQRGHVTGNESIFAKVRERIAEEFGVELAELVLIRITTLPRTSSGKVARRETEQRYVANTLDIVERFSVPVEPDTTPSSHTPTQAEIHAWLVARLARHLGRSPEQIDPHTPFASYGLDSLAMVNIAGELEQWLGRSLSPTKLYSAPTIAQLAVVLAGDTSLRTTSSVQAVDQRIAIVGIGCRFPGADGVDAFWDLLRQGRTAVGDLPQGRWPFTRPVTTSRGGYLDDVRGFDAAFFGINAKEAVWIDPQHRLLLEVAYHALENAGISPAHLCGTSTGVFVGISSNEYGKLILDHAGPDTYLGTGNSPSMAAHRLSYHFDLHGPSVVVDTACSSSLMAVHQACQSLRRGECSLALAGGVNLILTPDLTAVLSRAQMLSADGLCKTFDASADGYVRGEGAGVVVLKPLSAAVADGDPIWAVIEASAINQDGRSNSITAPNGSAQTALIRQALHQAGRSPHEVTCFEAHGTGTRLGDPIEFDAIVEAIGSAVTPCSVSAVKTNIGHLEAAAGIAGLIKAALQIHHRQIVPHLHLREINPLIRLEGSRFVIPNRVQDWDATTRLCGVSSFGFGGSNVHVLLGEHTAASRTATPDTVPCLIPLSARSTSTLRESADHLADWIRRHPETSLQDIAGTLTQGREHHLHRLVALARSTDDLLAKLDHWLSGRKSARDTGVQSGKVQSDLRGKVAFLFTGQGAAYPGMTRELYLTQPVFREELHRCAAILREQSNLDLFSLLESADALEETIHAQPAQFAFGWSLARLWQSWGVEPAAVMGHSVGEYIAACLAEVFTLEEGLTLIAERGRLMQQCPQGAMLACLASAGFIQPILERWSDCVGLAADNGPRQCVLAGDTGSLSAIAMELAEQGVESRMLKVGRAFHSRLIEPALEGLYQAASKIPARTPQIPLISNLTGTVHTKPLTPEYWVSHTRQPVQFEAGIRTLHQNGITHFIEIGPASVLTRLGQPCVMDPSTVWISSVGSNGDYTDALCGVGRLHIDGMPIRWDKFQRLGRRISLPTYPFQRQPFWYEDLPRQESVSAPVEVQTATTPSPRILYPCSNWRQALPRTPLPEMSPTAFDHLIDTVWQEHSLDEALQLRPSFDHLAGLYVATALQQLGWRPTAAEPFTLTTLACRLGVQENRHRLFGRVLELAHEDGWLQYDGNRGKVLRLPPGEDPFRLHEQLLTEHPDFEIELRLTAHCARHLSLVLQGKIDPLQVLFGSESLHLTSAIYSRSPVARYYNRLLSQTVAGILAELPVDRPIRILELGAGTGGTTQALLPLLENRPCEYVFTDVSSLFLATARDQFKGYPWVQYRALDLEIDPAAQGFADGQFDLVVAANVLHATANLRTSVRHARHLLAPAGMLILLEGTGPRRLLDLIFGLTEGWWRFRDHDVRPDYPLISPQEWLNLLHEEGFESGFALPAIADVRLPDPDQVVLVSRREIRGMAVQPTMPDHAGAWVVLGEPSLLKNAVISRLHASGYIVRTSAHAGMTDVVLLPGIVRDPLLDSAQRQWYVTLDTQEEEPVLTDSLRHIDLDPAQTPEIQAWMLTEALLHPDENHQVVYRGDQRYLLTRKHDTAGETKDSDTSDTTDSSLDRTALLQVSAFERRGLLERYLRQELTRILGTALTEEDMDLPVQSLGLDSLMAIQVRNRVETSLGVSLSLVDFLKGLRVRELIDRVEQQLAAAVPVEKKPEAVRITTIEPQSEVKTGSVGELSEREVDSLLASLMRREE